MKTPITLILALILGNLIYAEDNNKKSYDLVVGTYTSSTESEGLYVFDFDTQTGNFNLKSKTAGVENPSYFDISRDGNHLYSVNENKDGGISAFTFNRGSGELIFLNRVGSSGSSPCYISVDDKNKYVFAGNYGSGSLIAVPLKEDGSLGNDIQFIQQEGSSIDKSRQKGPHVHCTVLSPDNHYLITANLGTDKVCIYQFDASRISQPLTPAEPAFVSVKSGSGPRHFVFHPNMKFAYLISEMGGMITVFDYKDGKLIEKQMITMLSPDFKGRVGAADIHISPDGKFLYGSNRGDANELVIYKIDKKGQLHLVGFQQTMGKTPRNFVIDPTGNFLLVANQDSNEIIIFKRDRRTGLLTSTGGKIQVNKPVCLKFAVINSDS
ncbi:MAG: lactonase family protein [Bacteroidales bacterium]|nr:lactonase family protein [Bacteroidales bacterium]